MAPESVFEIMDEICAWLRANGIRPGDVPVDSVPKIMDGRVKTPVYLRRDGSKYLDEDGEPAMGEADVPLLMEPPEVLAVWLRGEVSVDSQ